MARTIEGMLTAPQGRFALCVTRWNAFITEELLKGAQDALRRHGVSEEDVDVIWVPGAFELPGVVRKVAGRGEYAGIVALGAVIRGGTPHFDYVAGEAAKGIAAVAGTADCAVTFGVLTTDSIEQAIERAGTKAGNKGGEAALACLELVNLYAALATPARAGKKK